MIRTLGVSVAAIALLGATGQRGQPVLQPTEALHRALIAIATRPAGTSQPAVVGPLLNRTDRDAAGEREQLARAALYLLNFQPDEADAIFSRFLDRRDDIGRWAWIYHEQMVFRAYDQYEQAERDLVEFRRMFPPTPTDLTYTSSMVGNLAGRYRALGEHARVAESMIFEDLAALDPGRPYRAFRLLGTYFDSIVAAGRGDEARTLLATHRDRLRALVAAAEGPVRPDRELFDAPPAHRAGQLHLSWHMRIADDDPAITAEVWAARVAADALPAIQEALARMGG